MVHMQPGPQQFDAMASSTALDACSKAGVLRHGCPCLMDVSSLAIREVDHQ